MKIPAPPLDNKYRILIVEDDNSISKLIEVQMQLAGFAPHVVSDGLAGWAEFEKSDPHLVLSDIAMPGIDGHELTRRVRAVSSVPIVLMTASGSDDFEMLGFKSGADDYVNKPFNPKILLARVVAHLRRVYRYDGAGASPVGTAPVVTEPLPAGDATGGFNFAAVKMSPPPPTRSFLVPPPAAESEAAVPDGWTKCDSCNYMGPEERFESTDLQGAPIIMCPNCKNRSVTFSIS
ncbi:MAG TPA: response regulator transcription factor [Abditibacterium sp.]|jgi:CheY-like chemotaxis protein